MRSCVLNYRGILFNERLRCTCMYLCMYMQSLDYLGEVVHLRGHDGSVNCLAACKPFSIIVTGSVDKTAIIWDTNR